MPSALAALLLPLCAAAGAPTWLQPCNPVVPKAAAGRTTAAASTSKVASRYVGNDTFAFLNNGIIILGVDTARGGSIGWLGPASAPTVNYVNTHDFGREVQGSFYSGPTPFNPPGCDQPPAYDGFPWNPIGAGDYYGHSAELLSLTVSPDNTSAVVVTRPAQWACNATPCDDCSFTQVITLVGSAVEVSLTLSNAREDRTAYQGYGQELPAVYLNGPLCNLWAYTGTRPFAPGESPSQLVPPGPQDGRRLLTPERWAAFVGSDGVGVGVWHPSVSTFGIMRWNGTNASQAGCDSGAGAHDDVTAYLSPQTVEVLDWDIQYAYNFSLVVGTVEEIRAYAQAKAEAGLALDPPDYDFTSSRAHFTSSNAVLGPAPTPAAPGLVLLMPDLDPNLLGPSDVWQAEEVPVLYINASYSPGQHDTTGQVFWMRHGQTNGYNQYDQLTFTIQDDGQYHVYAVPLSTAPAPANYTGPIISLRFDPVISGQAGASVTVASISKRAPPAGTEGVEWVTPLPAPAPIPATTAATTPWTPDRFLISFWVDPVVPPSSFPVEYARIAAANFTALMGGFGATDPGTVAQQVAACAAAGLACIPSSCESETGPNPGGSCVGAAATPVWGYQLKDEPPASDFRALATWAASVAQRAPGVLRFINLLPNYGFPAPSTTVYTQYVESFITTVKPDILCFDHYPLFYPGSESDGVNDVTMAGYHRNLGIVRTAALANGLPFYNFMNAMPYDGRPDVTEAQMRWQVFTSLAYGAKGVLYFCYWTPAGSDFVWANALMTPKALPGQPLSAAVYMPGPKYYQVQRINSKLRTYGTFLLRATSAFVFAANGTASSTNATLPPGLPIAAVGSAFYSQPGYTWSLLLGGFTGTLPTGQQAVLVQNQDPSNAVLVAVTLAANGGSSDGASFPADTAGAAVAQEVDPSTGAVAPVLNDAPGMGPASGGFYLYLEAGDARLLVF